MFKLSRFNSYRPCDNPFQKCVITSLMTPDSIPVNTLVRTFLTFTTLRATSGDNKLYFSCFPPRKQDLTFYANILLWRQLHEMSKPVFRRKLEKNFNLSSAIFPHYLAFKCADNLSPDQPAHSLIRIFRHTV